MDWEAEAKALIEDIKPFVSKVEVSQEHRSCDMKIYFDIETLEKKKFIVMMNSSGFQISDMVRMDPTIGQAPADEGHSMAKGADGDGNEDDQEVKVYETISALLDDHSPNYRRAFAEALRDRLNSIC